jgi:hypothetical protein
MVSADFAPSSLPSAQRIRFLARHLPEFGWNPVLITTDSRYYESAVDPENELLVPECLTVIRTPAIGSHMARKFGIGDIGMRSLYHHWRESCRLCSTQDVDLVFITVPPYVPMVLGRLLHHRFGIPYVIDYQDPWVTDYYWRLPRSQRPPKWPLAYALSRILEPFALRRAAGLVGVSQGTTDGVTERYGSSRSIPTAEIPLGGEPADFEYLAAHPRTQSIFDECDGLCHISYVGACIPPMYPAVRAIFAAVRSGLDRAPKLFSRLRLHFVGSSYAPPGVRTEAKVAALARAAGISEFVAEQPARASYLDSLQLLVDSSALLLIGSEEPHYTASKVFPYILSGRPILAIFHEDSSVIHILKNAGCARVVAFGPSAPPASQVEVISRHLEHVLTSPHPPLTGIRSNDCVDYTTRAMSARLAALFDTVIQPSQVSEEALV